MMVRRESLRFLLPALLLFSAPLVLIPFFGAPAVAASGAAAGAMVLMLTRPDLAAYGAIFVLYSNIAVVSQQFFPYPNLIAGSVALPLVVPIVYAWVVRRERLRIDKVFCLMAVFLCVQLASSFFAIDRGIALEHILTSFMEGIVLYFLVLNAVRSRRSLMGAVWAALLAGALLGALSVYQTVTHSYEQQFGGLAQRNLDYESAEDAASAADESGVNLADRAAGPVGDPNRYAQILVVVLPLSVFIFRCARPAWSKAVGALTGTLLLCGILLSYSRGAFVTLAVLVLLLVLLGSIRPAYVVGGLLLLAVATPFVAPGYYARIQTIIGAEGLIEKGARVSTDRVIKGRATEMLAALHVFLDHPVLGVGPGQYQPFYSLQYQLDPDIKLRQVSKERRAHDLYVEMGAETGVVGLAVFLAMPLFLLKELWRERRAWATSRPDLSNLATALCFSLLAYLGTGVFLHLSFERYYWFLLALAGAALQILRSPMQGDSFPAWSRDSSR